MAEIAIYADILGTDTTSVPCREMLLELMRLRRQDRFTFVFMRGSQNENWWPDFHIRIPTYVRWREVVLRRSRKIANILTLLGVPHQPNADIGADIYLRLHAGSMGAHALPLIQLVTDLSSLRRPAQSSLKWHGRILVRCQLRDGAALASRTICISEFTAADVTDAVPEIASKLIVIPNGIANAWFDEAVDGAPDERDPNRTPYFVWFGLITRRKNIEGLIKAYAIARQRALESGALPDLVLIAADEIQRENAAKWAAAAGVSDSVRIIPPQRLPRLVEYVSQSAGLVFPSFYEGFGMPIVEACARGVPVLTSNVTSMPEIAGGLAVLCDPDDVESIAQGLLRLADPGQRAADAVAARVSYASTFTARRSAQRYSELIDSVLAESTNAKV